MSLQIQFLGAAQTVTGSCFLVSTPSTRFLVDCGMFQGPDVEQFNLEDFNFEPANIDFVLLTHTHIDHSGMLPKLVKHGFNGPIYCSLHTADLVPILLLDSAKIQESNYKQGIPWKHAGKVAIAYSTQDAEATIANLRAVRLDEEFAPAADVKVKLVHAAHVLGAVSMEVETQGKKIVFSGDIGRRNHDLIGGFNLDYKAEVDYVVMESLYGNKVHPDRHESVQEMIQIVNTTFARGGSVFVPCFAVQRTQELLNDFKLAKQAGALAAEVPVWLDSPMAQKVTQIYQRALDHTNDSLFDFQGLRWVRNFRQSQKISRKPGQIIMAGSGMADGGRILEHLISNISNPKNTVLFVGYQAEGTIGRQLVTGARQVIIDDKPVNVKAQIVQLNGFSAHGDKNDYQAWLERYNSDRLQHVFLVHAEPQTARDLQSEFQSKGIKSVSVPERFAQVDL